MLGRATDRLFLRVPFTTFYEVIHDSLLLPFLTLRILIMGLLANTPHLYRTRISMDGHHYVTSFSSVSFSVGFVTRYTLHRKYRTSKGPHDPRMA
ncbi:hypothetical protein DFP72DRAFT_119486 [Ephemerocybe angulata]|uniref:Uncharacterized protein n=1 Tax=Ephemerocybe angulata TaxID=980116 RepID=A0A8H6I6T9_9AGAR|nr:hypothetical protein DFP72DRAFT_119486 [Tulosesus angulatus]